MTNFFNHNHRQLGEHVTDVSEREIHAEQLKAEKREMKLGSTICKSIQGLQALSSRASTLAMKVESKHNFISKPRLLWIEIGELNKKIDDLEADFLEYQS